MTANKFTFNFIISVLCSIEGGELFGRIKAKKQLEEDIAKLYFYQMLRAVEVRLYGGYASNGINL